MNQDEPTILPCPFCNGFAHIVSGIDDDKDAYWQLLCQKCGASSNKWIGDKSAKEYAIQTWNSRAYPTVYLCKYCHKSERPWLRHSNCKDENGQTMERIMISEDIFTLEVP